MHCPSFLKKKSQIYVIIVAAWMFFATKTLFSDLCVQKNKTKSE